MDQHHLTLDIRGDLDVAAACVEREAILSALDAQAGGSMALTLTSEDATQPALQLYFATIKEARLRRLAVRLGDGEDAALIAGRSLLAEDGGR